MSRLKNISLVLAVLVLAVRERWHMSRFNPWGVGSRGAAHRSTQDVVTALEKHGAAFVRTVQGTDGTPPSATNDPVQ